MSAPFKAAVIGDPIDHSKSPALFALFAKALRTRLEYSAVRVTEEGLAAALARFQEQGLVGVSVTRPLKRRAAAAASWKDSAARVCGAANCLSFAGGTVNGHNTDVPGLLDALALERFSPAGKECVIAGSGGAARAAAYAFAWKEAAKVRLAARNGDAASKIAAELGRVFPKTAFELGEAVPADLIVNTTPLGWAESDPSPVEAPRCALAFDMIYGRDTEFLKRARAGGAKTADGRAMLAAQALRAWELWLGPIGTPGRAALVAKALQELKWD